MLPGSDKQRQAANGGKDTAAVLKAAHIESKRPKSPRKHTVGYGFGRFCVSGANRQIGSAKRRWTLCPVCRNTSSKNGRSFLMSVAGRNITSFAGNAKGAASRASVPPLFTAHTIYRKGEQDNDRLSEQHFRKAGNHQGQRD